MYRTSLLLLGGIFCEMINILGQLNEIGWYSIVIAIVLVVLLVPLAIKAWRDFWKTLQFKPESEIEAEKIKDEISELKKAVETFQENRLYDIESIERIKETLNEIKSDALEEKIERMRWKVLDFAGALRNGQITCIEQFNYVLKTCDDYEKLLEKHGRTNGQVKDSIEYIHEKYHEMLANGN